MVHFALKITEGLVGEHTDVNSSGLFRLLRDHCSVAFVLWYKFSLTQGNSMVVFIFLKGIPIQYHLFLFEWSNVNEWILEVWAMNHLYVHYSTGDPLESTYLAFPVDL